MLFRSPLNYANQPNSQFLTSKGYRFDFLITDWNTAVASTANNSKWMPNPGVLFDYLTIRQCKGAFSDCDYSESTASVTTGAWKANPAITDLQQFRVYDTNTDYTDMPYLKMAFGASSGNTGLQSKITNVSKNISNILVGNGWGVGNMTPLQIATMDNWNAIPGASAYTAKNLISNLNLSIGQTQESNSYNQVNTSGPRCNGASSGFPRCALAIQYSGESQAVFFNVNSIAFQAVPGPLPILSACTAFGFSRKLRNRIKISSKSA